MHDETLAQSCCRVIRTAEENPQALLALLDECLGAVAGAGAPAQLVSPSAFALLRDVSQLLAYSYLDVTGGAVYAWHPPLDALDAQQCMLLAQDDW